MDLNLRSHFKELIFKYSSIDIKDSDDVDDEIPSCGVGGKIWKSAVVLSSFLRSKNFEQFVSFESKIIVEIGAGCGVCGLVAATLNPRKVYITDRNLGCLKLSQINVDSNVNKFNPNTEIEVVKFDWSESESSEDYSNIKEDVDIIIGSDVLYSLSMVDSLLYSIEKLCQLKKNSLIILALAERGEEFNVFVSKLNTSGIWRVEFIPESMLEEKFYKHFVVLINKI